MKGLTKKQTEILDYIHEFISNHRYAPTYREIGKQFNFSSMGTVHNHICSLKKKGALNETDASSRSISPANPPKIKETPSEISIPIAGYITAHNPIKTFSTVRNVGVPRSLVKNPDATYALTVQGTSFGEELINDGDLLIVEARQEAAAGETVVALINDKETVVRRYYPDGRKSKLVGTQLLHPPLIISNDDISIQGVVLGLIRTYG
jgi:repressor LexA